MRLNKAFPLTVLFFALLLIIPLRLLAGVPTFTSVTTDDNNGDGKIDRLIIVFSENVDISDPNGVADGLDCLTVTGYTIANGNYSAIDTGSLTLVLVQGVSYDTDAKPDVAYSQGQTSDIKSVSTAEEVADSYTFNTTTDGAKPVIVLSKTYDSNSNGYIDRVEYELSEPIVDVPGTDNFDIAGYGGESFSTVVTGINGGVDDTDADDSRFSIGFTQGGGYDTGNTPSFDYTADGTGDVEDPTGNKLASIIAGITSDGANPVLVAVEITRLNISGTNWWNRVNLTYSEPVLCGDLASDGSLAASDATAGNFNPASEHGGDYANGVLSGYGSFANGGNVTVPGGEVGVTVEAEGIVRFDLARSNDGHGSISSGNTAPSGNFTSIANTGIRDALVGGNSLITPTAVSPTTGTVWDLDKPTIIKAATYDSTSDGNVDRVEFEISDASSGAIQDGFNAANFDITGYGGEGFTTGVIGISGGADNDANDNRFSITFTQAGPWDTDATPGYSYTGSAIYLVDLAGNRLGNTSGTASDGALPAFRAITTGDNDEDGHIDRLLLEFSENVDINDAGGAGDGLNCINLAGYSITNGNYGATNVNSITLLLNELGSYDTGVKPATSYNTAGSSTIRDRAVAPNEMLNSETTTTSDGAKPIMLSAVFFDPDLNDIDAGDYIQIEFTEAVQLACTNVSDFELLNAAFGDSFGGGSNLEDIAADTYINIVLGTSPFLLLPDIWSVPGPGNPSGIGIKAGGTNCVEDLASNKSPQGPEVDIGGAGSNIITTVTATDGSSVYTNPYAQSVFMDADITVHIKTQYNANFVAVWFDAGAVPDGLSTTNPDDRRSVATGSGKEWTAVISHDDSEMIDGSRVQFIVNTDGAHYYYDGPEASGGSVPWEFTVIYEQPQRMTVRNNVINPQRGDLVYINYYLQSSTGVKITIYDLAGDPVKVLFSSTGSAGTNLVTWDGRNQRGAVVVPGVYYIVIKIGMERFVRKVLVVR